MNDKIESKEGHIRSEIMDYDTEKIDEVTLALLHLTMFQDGSAVRAWKGMDWGTLNRLYEKGYIYDPRGRAKSLTVSEEGAKRSEELFRQYFGKSV